LRHCERLIVRVEKRLFVLLEIALITRRQSLASRQQCEQRAVNPSRFSADQLPGIGIFLLRHQAASGGKFVG
jgi:hypothetical protein